MRSILLEISPLTHAHQIKRPILIVQGNNDPRVPASESEQIVKAVKQNGADVWYLLAKDEGHGFVKKKNIDEQTKAEVMFLQKLLFGRTNFE